MAAACRKVVVNDTTGRRRLTVATGKNGITATSHLDLTRTSQVESAHQTMGALIQDNQKRNVQARERATQKRIGDERMEDDRVLEDAPVQAVTYDDFDEQAVLRLSGSVAGGNSRSN